jgi:hypothetical protein
MKSIKGGFWDKAGKDTTKPNVVMSRPAGERKYSDMLLELMKPYLDDEPHPDDVEYMLELGIVAWNMAITTNSMALPVPNTFIDRTLEEADITGQDKTMVYEMIKQKNEKFPAATDVIQDYELTDDGEGMYNLTLHAQPLDNFLENMDMDEDDDAESMDELQYEEGLVNRSALLVQPTPAFWNLLQQHDATFKIPQAPIESTVYLIPEFFSPKELEQWLKKNFDKIFLNELEEWTFNDDAWPAKRTYKLFKECFTVAGHETVIDLEAEPVLKQG